MVSNRWREEKNESMQHARHRKLDSIARSRSTQEPFIIGQESIRAPRVEYEPTRGIAMDAWDPLADPADVDTPSKSDPTKVSASGGLGLKFLILLRRTIWQHCGILTVRSTEGFARHTVVRR